jgi:NitT/TauT family transport system permease protein
MMNNGRSRSDKPAVPLWVWQLLPGAAALALWQWLTTAGVLDEFFFSRPLDVARRLGGWISSGSVWPHLLTTLSEATLAFLIGAPTVWLRPQSLEKLPDGRL